MHATSTRFNRLVRCVYSNMGTDIEVPKRVSEQTPVTLTSGNTKARDSFLVPPLCLQLSLFSFGRVVRQNTCMQGIFSGHAGQ